MSKDKISEPSIGTDINVQNQFGNTRLHLATRDNNTDLATKLIDEGAKVSIKNLDGRTPLHIAIVNGNADLATKLIDNGADINLKDNEGFTPLDTASLGNPILGKNIHLIEYLINNSAKSGADESFTVAIKTWNKEALIKHIDNGANPNQKVNDEYSLLDNYFLMDHI